MAYGRDDVGGAAVTPGGREDSPAQRPTRRDEQLDQRARYLAKAASLGQVVLEDEPPDREHSFP
jgi:hypothetical protein